MVFVAVLTDSSIQISMPATISVKSTAALSGINTTAEVMECQAALEATTVEISGLQVVAYDVGTANQSFICPSPGCGRVYRWQYTLLRHYREECGREPRFQCQLCSHRSKQKSTLVRHMWSAHKLVIDHSR